MSDETMLAELRERLRPLRESYRHAVRASTAADAALLRAVYSVPSPTVDTPDLWGRAHLAYAAQKAARHTVDAVIASYPKEVIAQLTLAQLTAGDVP